MGLEKVPEWLGGGLVGALVAAVGYVGRLLFEGLHAVRRARAERDARLVELNSLLKASRALFLAQQVQVQQLSRSILAGAADTAGRGYERQFSDAFARFSQSERDLHSLIRAVTEHAMRSVNQALSRWLECDRTFKVTGSRIGRWEELAEKLCALEAHLRIWHAKFEAWIPGHPEHALVYLADEERHGVGFPGGLDELVSDLIERRGLRIRTTRS